MGTKILAISGSLFECYYYGFKSAPPPCQHSTHIRYVCSPSGAWLPWVTVDCAKYLVNHTSNGIIDNTALGQDRDLYEWFTGTCIYILFFRSSAMYMKVLHANRV